MLLLTAFEAVFVTNAIHRFLFGPPVQDIRGYLYLAERGFYTVPPPVVQSTPLWAWLVPVIAIVSSLPVGWLIARVRERHRALALAAFGGSLVVCSMANLQISLLAQFVTSAVFILGLLTGGSLEAAFDAQSSA